MDDTLTKSRRNLITISVVLILFDFAEVSIGQVSFLGTNLVIGNPDIIHKFMWITWAYLLLRYFQHLLDKGDLGLVRSFSEKAATIIDPRIQHMICAHNSKEQYTGHGYLNIRQRGLSWEIPLQKFEPSSGAYAEVGILKVPRLLLLRTWLATAFHISIRQPKVTEYILPIILAIAAPIVTLF